MSEANTVGDAIAAGATFERVAHDSRPRNQVLISCVRVEQGPGHDRVTVFNRGGNSGTLTVTKGDGATIARTLLPDARVQVWK